ncbi:MAG TPA: ThiF family adenylyltransferase [Longimicrobiales bacterium]|nr:ThiF family adenylyltransferase [Longimicrobiales bacterium]
MATDFDYRAFTGRNIGFVSEAEQARIRDASVFVCGVGGMGGACVLSLVRAGVGRLTIADIDRFELSNLNRQVFAFGGTLGMPKVDVVRDSLLSINPALDIATYGAEWLDELDVILPQAPVVINGMDDVHAGVLLYRKARQHGATVIDAYASPLPSVTVVRPDDPRPEERLRYPTVGRPASEIDAVDADLCLRREIEYVMTHSSSRHHIDMDAAAEVLAGTRKRMSFAPMVITAGNFMAFEAINVILDRRCGTDCRGYFFNPSTAEVERPLRPPLAWIAAFFVRRFLDRMSDER